MFRDKLITHFHKHWILNDIVWPSRTGKMKAQLHRKFVNVTFVKTLITIIIATSGYRTTS